MRDIVLKLGHQSQCFRICEYHKLRNELHIFGEGFGDTVAFITQTVKAVELGPHTNKMGPELVLLKGVTASPDALLRWLATPHMRGMCTRMYSLHPDTHPAQTKEDLLKELLCHPVPSNPVRLQCHPRSLEEYLQDGLPDWDFHPRHFGSVLHCVEIDGCYHFAVNSKRDSYLYAPLKEALDRHPACCRARKKLEEVFTALGMLSQHFGLAIDIGAAPGGWTSFLAERCTRVLAVDPAEMNSAALQENVTHLRSKAADAMVDIAKFGHADLLVCDMNHHLCNTLPVVQTAIPFVCKGGLIILTLKFFGIGRDRTRWVEKIRNDVKGTAEVVHVLWLHANTVNERTLVARRL